MSAIAAVEDEVGELVRRRGIDAVEQPVAVRRLVDERSISRASPPLLGGQMLTSSGRRVDLSDPFVDAMLPDDERVLR